LKALFHVIRRPVLQDTGSPLLLLLQIVNLSIISIAMLKNGLLTQGYRK
jgi:hypothetical protein